MVFDKIREDLFVDSLHNAVDSVVSSFGGNTGGWEYRINSELSCIELVFHGDFTPCICKVD